MSLAGLLAHDFVEVTEKTAVAAAQTMGYGDGRKSDLVATEAMREALDRVGMSGRIVIGEAGGPSMLRVGEKVGAAQGEPGQVDVAVDPLEGARLCATGASGAMAVLAAAESGGLLATPDVYMEKIMVGPTARGAIHLDAPVPENLRNIARSFGREVSDLTVVVLDRERHRQLVGDIRDAGARIRLITDGDLSAGIAAAVRGTGVHAVMGVGGAPEGVIAAAALRCLGGEIQARLVALDEEQEELLAGSGLDRGKIYRSEELARGESIVFSATGVTDGEFLRGVRFFGGGSRTSTLLMSLPKRKVRFIETIHLEDPSSPVHFH
jgi:fructose-1,6-bisphosphatase class II